MKQLLLAAVLLYPSVTNGDYILDGEPPFADLPLGALVFDMSHMLAKNKKATTKAIQSCLALLGHYEGEFDGVWSNRSQAAFDAAYEMNPNIWEACLDKGWIPPE